MKGWVKSLNPLRLLFLESSLELVPESIRGHPQVVESARRYGVKPEEMILDKSLHYNAMSRIPAKWKRGRPDILHVSLLTLQDSPLLEAGLLEVYFQAYDGRIFKVEPETRITKHYERWKGLMAQLLRTGRVPPDGRPLIYIVSHGLGEFLESGGHRLVLMWEQGERMTPASIAALGMTTSAVIGIGAFPRGDFKRSTLRKAWKRVSLGNRGYKAWGVAYRILYEAERLVGFWR